METRSTQMESKAIVNAEAGTVVTPAEYEAIQAALKKGGHVYGFPAFGFPDSGLKIKPMGR